MHEILSVLVGSRLHRLDDENSDEDTRRIIVPSLREALSPFHIEKGKVTQGDDVSYELRHFCKLAAQGNPTILEVLWSDLVLFTTRSGQILQQNRQKFLDKKRVFDAHWGYAYSEAQQIPTAGEKAGKKKASVLRVLEQGTNLLLDGDTNPAESAYYDILKLLRKNELPDELYDFYYRIESIAINAAYEQSKLPKQDIEWIEEFIVDVYTREYDIA